MGLDLGAGVLRGTLQNDGSRWRIGETSLDNWLHKYANQQVILIAAPIEQEQDPVKTCGVCGRDYVGDACPYCREARMRLRRE